MIYMKKKTDKEQLTLKNKAKDELIKLENIMDDSKTMADIDAFKNKFLICEKIYKVLLKQHLKERDKLPPNEVMKITMSQVKPVLHNAGYDFNNEILNKLFGSEERLGKKSVKKIRDRLTHSMIENDINEFKERKDELNGYMDYFIEKVRNFDKAV